MQQQGQKHLARLRFQMELIKATRQAGSLQQHLAMSLASLHVDVARTGGATNGIAGISVNGNLLIDHNNIGVDVSGNDNHFHDSNFALTNTVVNYTSQTTITGTGHPTKPPTNLFKGLLVEPTQGTTLRYDFPAGLITGTKIELRLRRAGNPGDVVVNDINNITVLSNTLTKYLTNVTELRSISLPHPSAGNANIISGVFVDDVLLLDTTYEDTVLDTPMNNYAVLETGTNGNLVASADGTNVTYMGDAGVDYYYEADGTGAVHTGGTAFSSTSGVTYNFGQQPFADGGPQGDQLTLFQTWLEWNDVATFLADNPAHVLTYQTIEAALESYEGNRDAFRAALRQRLIDDGYAPEEVEVLGL